MAQHRHGTQEHHAKAIVLAAVDGLPAPKTTGEATYRFGFLRGVQATAKVMDWDDVVATLEKEIEVLRALLPEGGVAATTSPRT